jgi:hypothetical protein
MSGSKFFSTFELPGKSRRVQEQPVLGGGIIGGIWPKPADEKAEISGILCVISNPSRGANKIDYL